MRALLDTHAFLWSTLDSDRLSAHARTLLEDGSNDFLLSAASVWEICIKHGKGKLDLAEPPESYLPKLVAKFGYTTLPVAFVHALRTSSLPQLHTDPFDRLLVAQAQVEGLPILTSDPNISLYDVKAIW